MFYENFGFLIIFYTIIKQWTVASELKDDENLDFEYSNDRRAVIIGISGFGKHSFAGLRMEKLFEQGSSATFKSGYPTTSIATSFSIVTGVYPKDHGVLMDPYLDFRRKQYITSENASFFTRKNVEPIWVTNQLNGKNSSCINWPGGQFKYKNGRCTHSVDYTGEPVNITDLCGHAIASLFDTKDQPTLIMIYYERLNKIAEKYGPVSLEYIRYMREIDDMIMYLYYQIKVSQLANRTTLFVIGTHYFVQAPYIPESPNPNQNGNGNENGNGNGDDYVELPLHLIEKTNLSFQVSTPIARFKFDKSFADPEVHYRAFLKTFKGTAFSVFPNRTPPHWHTDKDFIGDALVLARPGTYFYDFVRKASNWSQSENPQWSADRYLIGLSGYDNTLDAMKGFFWWQGNDSRGALDAPDIDVTEIKSFLLEAINNDKKVEQDDTSGSSETWRRFTVYSLLLFLSVLIDDSIS